MDYFWGNLFEYFRERRTSGLFFGTLLAFLGGAIVWGIFYEATNGCPWLMDHWPALLAGLGVLLAACLVRSFRRARRARRLNRYKSTPLSRDEWVKARSKLSKQTMIKRL
jgi:cobalamin biosynthesis protein CobD/CbiB